MGRDDSLHLLIANAKTFTMTSKDSRRGSEKRKEEKIGTIV